MKHVLFWKGLAVAGLALMLIIPLMMIEGQISARKQRDAQVQTNIAQSAAGAQQIVGPMLVVDYRETETEWVRDEKTGELAVDARTGKTYTREVERIRHQVVVPKDLVMDGDAKVEERHRGLYKAQVFNLEAKLSGHFEVPAGWGIPRDRSRITLGRVQLVLGVTDLRGIQNRPHLIWAGRDRLFEPGAIEPSLGRGLVVDLGPASEWLSQPVAFEIPSVRILGTKSLSFAPVAEDNQVRLRSDWSNPSFGGRFLPSHHRIDAKGFEAQWQVSSLARDLDPILAHPQTQEAFQVSFLAPVDVYLQAERAVKYGFLFVGLVFAGFFLFEVLNRLPIHPIQYLLVGLSLALFFLLLISLSEHVPFLVAYCISSAASVLLLGVYMAGVLKGLRPALAFSLGIALLYGVLYGLLASEDNALLMGSLLLFALLGAVMTVTRKLDWYGLGRRDPETGD
jgi:inner membrane protein